MIKTVCIVSLSSGVAGEPFVSHEVKLGIERLRAYGLDVRFAPHALRGMEYLSAHPEARAADLLQALCNPTVDMILCAIGGDDTYRLLPYLFEHDELAEAVSGKVFLGFSDTTINHLMLRKVGLRTFYGQAFLPDVCELGPTMLPYTRRHFEELLATDEIASITPSDTWYESRTDFGPDQLGACLRAHPDRGFRLVQGPPVFSGKILGGCIDTLFDMFDGTRYADMPELCRRYGLFPTADEWRGHILLLETSEELMEPATYRKALGFLRDAGVFEAVSGVLVGKPMDERYQADYERALVEAVADPSLPIVSNVNVGHALPRCIIPLEVNAQVDATRQVISFATDVPLLMR